MRLIILGTIFLFTIFDTGITTKVTTDATTTFAIKSSRNSIYHKIGSATSALFTGASETTVSYPTTKRTDSKSEEEEGDESMNVQTDESTKGDTSIVQNNYNVKVTSRTITVSEMFWYGTAFLLFCILILGFVILSIVLYKVLNEKDPVLVMPPPAPHMKWTHEPIFELPRGYTRQSGQNQGSFREASLSPPKYE